MDPQVPSSLWRSEYILGYLALSIHHVGPRNLNQSADLAKVLILLNHLANLHLAFQRVWHLELSNKAKLASH